jgi:glucokinase
MSGISTSKNADSQLLTLGVDIGGSKVDTALVDKEGKIIATHYRPIDPEKDPDKVARGIKSSVEICLQQTGLEAGALGVGVAGQIDKDNGIVRSSPNLPGWHDVPLKNKLESLLDIPVFINNDVRVATIAEWKFGSGKGLDNFACLFVGTGAGGGAVTGGRLLEGYRNTAAEFGHITIVAGGRQCRCPNKGCLEAYAGGWAIAARAQEAVRNNLVAGEILLRLAGGITGISAINVAQAFRQKDPLAQKIVYETAAYLAAGTVSIVNSLNPSLVILGGSVIFGLPEYLPLIERSVHSNALPTAVEGLRIVISSLENKAGVIGAAAMARQLIE